MIIGTCTDIEPDLSGCNRMQRRSGHETCSTHQMRRGSGCSEVLDRRLACGTPTHADVSVLRNAHTFTPTGPSAFVRKRPLCG